MGIAYRYDPDLGLTTEVWDRDITLAGARRHIANLAADAQWPTSRRIITDLTGMSEQSRPSPEDVAQLADAFLQQLAYLVTDVKWAVIADSTFEESLGFGARIRHEVRRMIVFNSLANACIWLGLEPSDVRPTVDGLRRQLRRDTN